MVAKNLQGARLAGRRQTHAVMLFAFHEGWLLCSELCSIPVTEAARTPR
jgi:hypothetical protein